MMQTMTRLIALALVTLLALAAGCATSGPPQGEYYPSISDVPPSFYDYDPMMSHWYTYPYWDPERF